MTARSLAFACLALAAALPGSALSQSRDPSEPTKPPTIIIPATPSPPTSPPAGLERPAQSRADFCCTAYGRFGPVGGSGQPGAPCQWTLPSSVAQGSTCN